MSEQPQQQPEKEVEQAAQQAHEEIARMHEHATAELRSYQTERESAEAEQQSS